MTEQRRGNQKTPGPLSAAHTDFPGLQNCQKCHSTNMDIDDKKCLACHTEIASRISAKRGYHKDKSEGCALCHTEHQGEEANLIVMDILVFDHDETGYVLRDAHQKIKDCAACHRKNNSVPRVKTKSFLLKDSKCISCHDSPHPGRQDQCHTCHNQQSWRVDIWSQKDT